MKPLYKVYEKTGSCFIRNARNREVVFKPGTTKLIGFYYDHDIALIVMRDNPNRYIEMPKETYHSIAR
jgi:hypothetical protein